MNFETQIFEYRFIELVITETLLMHPPIVYNFEVFASPSTCVLFPGADSFSIPIFISLILLAFCFTFFSAVTYDMRKRWQV